MLSHLEIDREHDVAYILLKPKVGNRRGAVARSVKVGDDLVLDLDGRGRLVGIEFLHASQRLNLDTLSEGPSDLVVGVKEAARIAGVNKSNFVRDFANSPDFPAPIAELGSGRLWLKSAVERFVQQKANVGVRGTTAAPIAPTKVTGGGGFVFETRVGAYFSLLLVAGKLPFDPTLGSISRVAFQTRGAGWWVDDILLTLSSAGQDRFAAISVKDRAVFSDASVLTEIARTFWQQFLGDGSDTFDKDRDLLVLVTSNASSPLLKDFDELLHNASAVAAGGETQIDPQSLSAAKRRLWKAFACPDDLLATYGVVAGDHATLLSRMRVVALDFGSQTSRDEQAAIGICQALLESGDPREAVTLWRFLCSMIDQARPRGGAYTLSKLLTELRPQFRLKSHPGYRRDWDLLLRLTADRLGSLDVKIASRLQLDRAAVMSELEGATANRAVALLGPSGSGKTAAIKAWADKRTTNDTVVWLSAADFEFPNPISFEGNLRLDHHIAELFSSVPTEAAHMVIDGIDRLASDESFVNVRFLIQSLSLTKGESPWHLLVTCQPEEWSRIQAKLLGAGLREPFTTMVLPQLNDSELEPVWNTFPGLRALCLQRHLMPVLRNPKVLDVMARELTAGTVLEAKTWVGESDVINWVWANVVRRGQDSSPRSAFLQRLAQVQADSLRTETALLDLQDLEPLDGLIRDDLCRRHGELVRFAHDLFGDWARQRILLSRRSELNTYLSGRSASPLWHRAIRLLSLDLLEQNDSTSEWRSLMTQVVPGPSHPELVQDLMLEAVIFAANAPDLLQKVSADLFANNGELLRRLLRRFLHVATFPNPMILAISKGLGDELDTFASTQARLPYWPYWLPMLRYLTSHSDEVMKYAWLGAAEIAETWLARGLEGWPLRAEIAELAVSLAENMREFKRGPGMCIVEDKVDDSVFVAALTAARELPERVGAFALEAAGRTVADGDSDHTVRGRRVRSQPWPDGPKRRPDESFRQVALDSNALIPLLTSVPATASEVLLALLIEPPQDRDDDRIFQGGSLLHDLHIHDVHGWFPPAFFRGPFLPFLQRHPAKALDLIVRLVNFSVERFVEFEARGGNSVDSLKIVVGDRPREWAADPRLFAWYRDYPPAPHAVVVALMALEKWLYDEMDAGKNVDWAISALLERTNSTALVGPLVALGKRHPKLFVGPMQLLLTIPDLFHLDLQLAVHGSTHTGIGWFNAPRPIAELSSQFNSLPHRSVPLRDMALFFFLNNPEARQVLKEIRSDWERQLADTAIVGWRRQDLEDLQVRFDLERYQTETTPDGSRRWVFTATDKMTREWSALRSELEDKQLLLVFPARCRRLLDTGQSLVPTELEAFWEAVQHVAELKRPSDFPSGMREPEDAACAGIAVLICLHREWLKAVPERDRWCREFIIQTICAPPPAQEFDTHAPVGMDGWDHFCADALPVLWNEDQSSPIIRKCVARLACAPHYNAVGRLARSAFRLRQSLRDDVWRLAHLILSRAAISWAARGARRGPGVNDIHQLLDDAVEEFVAATLSPDLPQWQVLAESVGKLMPLDESRKYRRPRGEAGVDVELVTHAFDWLPSLQEAHGEAERARWVAFWKECFKCTVRTIGEPAEGEWEVSGTPYDFDRWTMARIAAILPELRRDEWEPAPWKTILDLGASAHYWVEDFLQAWFQWMLLDDIVATRRMEIWRAMLEYAFLSPKWEFKRGWFRVESLWTTVMGLDAPTRILWREVHGPVVSAMRDYYQKWADSLMKRPRCGIQFARFLETPPAVRIVPDGLLWLRQASESNPRFWTDEKDAVKSIASALAVVWHRHESLLRTSPAAFEAFRHLLKALAEQQEPLALELQTRLAGGS